MCTANIWFDLIRHHLDNAVPALYKLEGGGHWPQYPYGSPTWWREHPMECSYKSRGIHPELAIPRMEVLIWTRWRGVVGLQALQNFQVTCFRERSLVRERNGIFCKAFHSYNAPLVLLMVGSYGPCCLMAAIQKTHPYSQDGLGDCTLKSELHFPTT